MNLLAQGNWSSYKEAVERHKHLVWEVESFEDDGTTPQKVNVYKILGNGSKTWWFPLHFFEGTQTAGIYKFKDGKWARYCSSCEEQELNDGQLRGPLNTNGYCRLCI